MNLHAFSVVTSRGCCFFFIFVRRSLCGMSRTLHNNGTSCAGIEMGRDFSIDDDGSRRTSTGGCKKGKLPSSRQTDRRTVGRGRRLSPFFYGFHWYYYLGTEYHISYKTNSEGRKKHPPPIIMSNLQSPPTEEDEVVVEWTDACIRWTEDDLEPHMRPSWSNKNKNKVKVNHKDSGESDDDEEEEGGFLDPFADPNPVQEFTFKYNTDARMEKEENQEDETTTSRSTSVHSVHVTVQGFKADSDETWESTGLTLWKATHTLNDYILKHYRKWVGCSILELGAGLGVCGILTAKLIIADQLSSSSSSSTTTIASSAAETEIEPTTTTTICLTDGDTQALALLRENVKRNDCTRTTTRTKTTSTTVRQLLWGRENAQQFATTAPAAAAGGAEGSPLSYHIILASDIIYAPQVLVPLWETIQVLLAQDGTFILAFAKRKVPVQVQDVLRTANEYGFDYTTTTPIHVRHHTQHSSETDQHNDVFLYEFHRQTTLIAAD